MRFNLLVVMVLMSCSHKNGGGTPDAPGTGVDAPGTGIDAPGTGVDALGSTASCTAYCNSIQTACVGANAQYTSVATCVAACMLLPAGPSGATSGNSLACRATHTQLAMSDPNTHCVHAGPSGGATCGVTCEGFCAIAATACPTEYPTATCAADCAAIPTTPPYSTANTTGDLIECRLYYATLAATDPTTNCIETGQNSTRCQ